MSTASLLLDLAGQHPSWPVLEREWRHLSQRWAADGIQLPEWDNQRHLMTGLRCTVVLELLQKAGRPSTRKPMARLAVGLRRERGVCLD